MAVNNITVYNRANDGMALPLSITRGNPNPLDDTYLYATLAEAKEYAKNGATAYVGQNICVLNSDIVDGAPVVYVIQDEAGTLKPVGDAADIFSDPKWVLVKERIELLDSTDDTKEGSLARIISDSKITIALDTTTTDGSTTYNVYQGYTYSQVQDVESDGVTPKVDGDGNPVMVTKKTPNIAGKIGIAADLIISGGSVVNVSEVLDGAGLPIQATDEDGNLIFEADGITPVNKKEDSEGDNAPNALSVGKYLKLKVSNGDSIYIATKDLAAGLVDSIKTATHTYVADANGDIDMSTTFSTDDIVPGTIDRWILNGGDASTI